MTINPNFRLNPHNYSKEALQQEIYTSIVTTAEDVTNKLACKLSSYFEEEISSSINELSNPLLKISNSSVDERVNGLVKNFYADRKEPSQDRINKAREEAKQSPDVQKILNFSYPSTHPEAKPYLRGSPIISQQENNKIWDTRMEDLDRIVSVKCQDIAMSLLKGNSNYSTALLNERRRLEPKSCCTLS